MYSMKRSGKVHVVHAAEDGVVQAVQADGDAPQPRVLERAGLARQQRAVGGQRQVGPAALHGAQPGELGDEPLQVLAQQGLAAGQADLAHAVRHEQARQPRDLLEAQQVVVREVAVVAVEHFLGHAVAAAEVAPVGHADAQVAQGPPAQVRQLAARRSGHAAAHGGRQHRAALVHHGDHTFSHGPNCAPRGRVGWPGQGGI
jgi:hypothetical protein